MLLSKVTPWTDASFSHYQLINKWVVTFLNPTDSDRMFPCASGTSEYRPGLADEDRRVWWRRYQIGE